MKRKLLISTAVVLCAAAPILWWQCLAPSSTRSWSKYRNPASAWINGEWKYNFLETTKLQNGGTLPDENILKKLREMSQDNRNNRLIISESTKRFHYLTFEFDFAENGPIQENQASYRGKEDNKIGLLTVKKGSSRFYERACNLLQFNVLRQTGHEPRSPRRRVGLSPTP